MSMYEIRANNYIQPNRYFCIHGNVKFIEREVKFTKVILSVFNYANIDGKPDNLTVYFKKDTKKVVDSMIYPNCSMMVMGDIVFKDGTIFFDGKIVEIYKSMDYVIQNNAKIVNPEDANYDTSY